MILAEYTSHTYTYTGSPPVLDGNDVIESRNRYWDSSRSPLHSHVNGECVGNWGGGGLWIAAALAYRRPLVDMTRGKEPF